MPTPLRERSDEELLAALHEHGSQRAAAEVLGVAQSTLSGELDRRGLVSARPSRARRRRPAPRLTRESLSAALEPPNTCKVKAFLDTLDDENREVVTEALRYEREDCPAATLRNWLIHAGFHADDVPGQDAINNHRAGRRPCRCHG